MPGITTFAGTSLIIAGKGLTIEIPVDAPCDPVGRALCGGSQRADKEKEDDYG